MLLLVLRQDPPTLATYKDEQKGMVPSPGTEWAGKSTAFRDFLSKCMRKAPKDRAKVKELLESKFLRNKKTPTMQKFSSLLNTKITKKLHHCTEESTKDSPPPSARNTELKTTRSFVEGKDTDWDFAALLGTTDDDAKKKKEIEERQKAAAEAAAEKEKGVNDDNVAEEFMKSTTMRETT